MHEFYAKHFELQNISRIVIGLFYIFMGIGLIKDFDLIKSLMKRKKIVVPAILLSLTIVTWFVGGASLVFYVHLKEGALLLLGVTILVTVVIHNFWTAPAETQANELQHFLKNMAICAALLALI